VRPNHLQIFTAFKIGLRETFVEKFSIRDQLVDASEKEISVESGNIWIHECSQSNHVGQELPFLRARAPPEEEEQVTGDESSSYKVTFLHTGQLSMFGSDRLLINEGRER